MGKLQAIVSQQPSHFSSTPTASSSPRGSNPDDLMVNYCLLICKVTNYLMEWFYIIGPLPRKHFSYPRLNAENFDCGAARQDRKGFEQHGCNNLGCLLFPGRACWVFPHRKSVPNKDWNNSKEKISQRYIKCCIRWMLGFVFNRKKNLFRFLNRFYRKSLVSMARRSSYWRSHCPCCSGTSPAWMPHQHSQEKDETGLGL